MSSIKQLPDYVQIVAKIDVQVALREIGDNLYINYQGDIDGVEVGQHRGKSMAVSYPVIGHWYRSANGNLFEVVAVDEKDATVELQFFDGTIDEVDLEIWPSLLIETVGAPEDWSGSVDMDPEDYIGEDNGELPLGWHDPLEMLDKAD